MNDMPEELVRGLRQYRHNNEDKFVFGFDGDITVKAFLDLKSKIPTWKNAFLEKPDCTHFTGSSDCVLVVRDCGEDTLESYAISKYREKGWGDLYGSNRKYQWLDQEVNGYRVTKWCYLPPSKEIKTIDGGLIQ